MKITFQWILSLVAVMVATIDRSHASVFDKEQEMMDIIHPRPNGLTSLSFEERFVTNSDVDRQASVWNVINSMHDYKAGRIWNGKTFASFHCLVMPVYWSNESSTPMDLASIRSAMDKVVENYSMQSWNRLSFTYEVLPQSRLTEWSRSNTRFSGVKSSMVNLAKSKGYIRGQHYDGILLVFNPGSGGTFDFSGGLAELNGFFATASYPLSYGVARHEFGHNFFHYHHANYHYDYRNSRPDPPSIGDGFDMMSGGNGFRRSDFGIASKWFYNWVTDDNIVSMQPEGSTPQCPSCKSSGTFTLKSFDNWWDTPGPNNIFGIHIPVMTLYDNEWETQNVYSYWLSYRTGVDGYLSGGLSIHMAWFELTKPSLMGAWYDSMNYDAVGYTDNKADSAVTAHSCYHIHPLGYLADRDIVAAHAVQPVVCVGSVDVGNSITLSVHFIDPHNKPAPSKSNVVQNDTPCKEASFTMNSSNHNIIRVTGMGGNGSLSMSLASSTGNAYAFFYDDYPFSPLSFNSNPPYGSMKRLYSTDKTDGGECTDFYGATVIKITSNRQPPVSINEILLLDESGRNVASEGQCYSSSSSAIGDPNCLNDGVIGFYPSACITESAVIQPGSFDFCVLPEPVDIKTIVIHPAKEDGNGNLTNRLRSIMVELFATTSGLDTVTDYKNAGNRVSFVGKLASFELKEVFTARKSDPWYGSVDMDLPFSICSEGMKMNQSITYKSLFGEVYAYVPPWSGNGVTTVSLTCQSSTCLANQYSMNGYCNSCPTNHRAPPGSTSSNACWPCPEGTGLLHPLATWCAPINPNVTSYPTKAPSPSATSNPTSAPVKSPTRPGKPPVAPPTDCKENRSDEFFLEVRDGRAILQTCQWLSNKQSSQIDEICSRTGSYYDEWFPAKEVCRVTCSTCDGDNDPPTRSPVRSPTRSPVKSPTRSPVKSPTRSPVKSPTRSPTGSPVKSPTRPGKPPVAPPTDCKENRSDEFFLEVRNGRAILQTCQWLSNKQSSQIDEICSRTDSYYDEWFPAKEVCRVTCSTCDGDNDPPTRSPVKSPTRSPVEPPTLSPVRLPTMPPSSCEENATDVFLLKFLGGNPITKTCEWLAQSESTKISSICAKKRTHEDLLPAKDVCRITCETCRVRPSPTMSPVSSPTCSDDDSKKFFLKHGTNRPRKKTCSWLRMQKGNRIQRICKNSTSVDGLKPAKKVCLMTCNTC